MTYYVLAMSCVNSDSILIHSYEKESIVGWIKQLDHEGSSWEVTERDMDGDITMEVRDVTEQFLA